MLRKFKIKGDNALDHDVIEKSTDLVFKNEWLSKSHKEAYYENLQVCNDYYSFMEKSIGDWGKINVYDRVKNQTIDIVNWTKFNDAVWTPDCKGLLY